ncbi:hypothetical protein KAR91_78505 [Candidatus Pacearchaeota archaeon]|nr:hypothetical protein [Candidatus Pacearchaeota archaeon]
MALIMSTNPKVSAVLKKEDWPEEGWCRKLVSVTVTSGMTVGAVLAADGTHIAIATVANAALVLIDADVDDLAAGAHDLWCIARGKAIVGREALTFADAVSSANIDTAAAALFVLGIRVDRQVA